MISRRVMIADVVEPVGRNANMILVKTGVMEMGRKSACCFGGLTLGIGRIMACFHCCETVEVKTERLNRGATGRQKSGAPSLRNQAGRPPSPVAVGRRWSNILNNAIQ